MQRFFALMALFILSIPVGISIAGCGGTNPQDFCLKNGFGFGEKTTDLDHISLGPASTGISLAYGQTGQVNQPTGFNCLGGTVSVAHYVYGSTNLSIADINPATGAVCAGSWNRFSASGIPDFTICTPPTGPGVGQVTASASAVTSNPVNVYIHPPITAIQFPTQTACVSQNQTLQNPLTTGTNVFGPDGVLIPSQYVGTVTYTPVNATIVNINNTSNGTTTTGTTTTTTSTVNGLATALQPGSTVVNATISGVTSAAGYFFTCPPANIDLKLNGSNGIPTPVTVNASSPQTVTSTVTDTTGATLSGLALDYASTEPKQIGVSSAGLVTPVFPTTTTVTAICQPGTCNPAPINIIGQLGTGLPVASDKIIVNTPGRSSTKLWLASSQSSYFTPIDLTATGAPTPIKLPYIPNSMVLDQNGANLYFGSYHELMVYNAATNTLAKEDPNVPGVVLAVSPDSSTAVINDQINQTIYLYNESKATFSSIGGLATRAQFSPDGKNLYITGPNAFYVYNTATGWHSTPTTNTGNNVCTTAKLNNNNDPTTYDPFCSPDITVTIPSVGPFITGANTTAYGFCPNTTTTPISDYYPLAATVAAQTDHLTATNDGTHILGASASPAQIADISVNVPTGTCPAAGIKFQQGGSGSTPGNYTINTTALSNISPSEINAVVSSPTSAISFITYSATSASGLLPAYTPSTTFGTAGTLTNVQLSTAPNYAAPQAPVSGVFSPDDSTFFVGTTGDNLLHLIDVTSSTPTDTQTIDPKLPACVVNPSGGTPVCTPTTYAPVQFIVVQPRTTT
jgi:trimeric autotransporter adhesin